MDSSELAKLLLEWEELEKQQAIIAEAVEKEVLKLGKTFRVGNVSASYTNPRKKYDYETGAMEHPHYTEELNKHYEKVTIDWRGMCKELGAKAPYEMQGEPKVTIKIK